MTATKAVAFALVPGMEHIKFATLWSQRRGIGPYVEFVRSEESLDPEVHPEMMEVVEWKTNYKVRVTGRLIIKISLAVLRVRRGHGDGR